MSSVRPLWVSVFLFPLPSYRHQYTHQLRKLFKGGASCRAAKQAGKSAKKARPYAEDDNDNDEHGICTFLGDEHDEHDVFNTGYKLLGYIYKHLFKNGITST